MELADSIHPSIRVTGDIPTNYEDAKLPILDLKVWIGETLPGVFKIITSHYMKDVSTRAVINNRSSHPMSMKKQVMVNEVLRILRNCNEFCSEEEVASHVSYFMKRLQFSGYEHQFRYEVVKRALAKHEEKTARNDEEQETQQKKKKNNWFKKKEDVDAVMFVQATDNEEMKKEIQKCAERNKMKLKIIEKVESNIRKELQRSNSFKSETCGNAKCKICELETGVNFKARGYIYEIHCKLCDRMYCGQTDNSAQERINQHFNDCT